MFSKINLLALVMLGAGSVLAAPLVINTPVNVVSGHPTIIEWAGGVPPFDTKVLTTAGALVVDFGSQSANTVVWNTDVAAGTTVIFDVIDSTHLIAQSGAILVQ